MCTEFWFKTILGLGLIFLLSSCGSEVKPQVYVEEKETPSKYVYLGGVLRYNAATGKWFAINDAGHTPINIRDVVTAHDHVEVYYPSAVEKIHTFSVTVDEAYAAQGIFVGASVGLDYARIYFYQVRDGQVHQMTSSEMAIKSSNLWVSGWFVDENAKAEGFEVLE